MELLRSCSTFQEQTRRVQASLNPGKCMQTVNLYINLDEIKRFGNILSYAPLNLAYLVDQLHTVCRNMGMIYPKLLMISPF